MFFKRLIILVFNPLDFKEYIILCNSLDKIGINAIAMLIIIAIFSGLTFTNFNGVNKSFITSAI